MEKKIKKNKIKTRARSRFARLTRAKRARSLNARVTKPREEIRALPGYAARRRVRSCEVVPHGGGTWNERIGWGSWVAVDPACVCTCVVCRERAGAPSAPRQAGIRTLVIASLVYRLASRERRNIYDSPPPLWPQFEETPSAKPRSWAQVRAGSVARPLINN